MSLSHSLLLTPSRFRPLSSLLSSSSAVSSSSSFFLLGFSSFLLSYLLIQFFSLSSSRYLPFPSSSSPPIYAIPGSYGDSGLAVNCVWCNPRGFYNRDFHPFFLPPGLSTGRPSTLSFLALPPATCSSLRRLLPPRLLPRRGSSLFLYPPFTSSLPLRALYSRFAPFATFNCSRLVLKSVSHRAVFRRLTADESSAAPSYFEISRLFHYFVAAI